MERHEKYKNTKTFDSVKKRSTQRAVSQHAGWTRHNRRFHNPYRWKTGCRLPPGLSNLYSILYKNSRIGRHVNRCQNNAPFNFLSMEQLILLVNKRPFPQHLKNTTLYNRATTFFLRWTDSLLDKISTYILMSHIFTYDSYPYE